MRRLAHLDAAVKIILFAWAGALAACSTGEGLGDAEGEEQDDDDEQGEEGGEGSSSAGSGGSSGGTSGGDGGGANTGSAEAGDDDASGGSSGSTGPHGSTGSTGTTGGTTSGGATSDEGGEASSGSSGSTSTGTSDDTGGSDETTSDTGTDSTTGDVCDAVEPVTLYLSPDDSNSMASPILARDLVASDPSLLAWAPIRPWEFFNYYTFDYPSADVGTLDVVANLYAEPGAPEGEYTLQIAVSSEVLANAERPPINLTLVLDTSGSMSGHPLDMLKASCNALAASMKAGDRVSMVSWNTANNVVLDKYEVQGANDPTLLAAIASLAADGGTDLHSGLVKGYELANDLFDVDRLNRVVLISDGGANVGITDVDIIAQHSGGQNQDGIYMMGIGVGYGTGYNDALMDKVTDVGKGASLFVSDESEAWKLLNDRFVNTVAVAARDVSVRLDLPPGFEIVRFGGEEYSGDPTEIEPQHIAPNDTMVFYQTIATCAPELVTPQTQIGVSVSYKHAKTFAAQSVELEATFAELLVDEDPQIFKAAAVFAYAHALHTRVNRDATVQVTIAEALEALAKAEASLPGDGDLAEIRSVLEAL